MPPYEPPTSHYCEINAFTDPSDNFKLIGPNGHNFKRLTVLLGLNYIWWNMERNVIEIWGPYSKIVSSPKYLTKYMGRFYDKHCKNESNKKIALDVQQSKRLKVSDK